MPREPIPTWSFALTVVRLGHRFLLVQERKHGANWYLPAGRVDPGETFAQTAVRETLEEAGVPIALDGVLRVEHTPTADGTARCRVIFLGHPTDDTLPKAVPDDESLRAGWFTLAEAAGLGLRGDEVLSALRYVANGGAVYPLSLLTFEGAPFPG
jgi:phosphatase NudJ